MTESQLKEMLKKLLSDGEIDIRVECDFNSYSNTVETTVDVIIDREVITSSTDKAYLR